MDIDKALLKRLRRYKAAPAPAVLKERVLRDAVAAMERDRSCVADVVEVRKCLRFVMAAAAALIAVLIAGALLNGGGVGDGVAFAVSPPSAGDLALLKEFDMPSRHVGYIVGSGRFDMRKRFELERELR